MKLVPFFAVLFAIFIVVSSFKEEEDEEKSAGEVEIEEVEDDFEHLVKRAKRSPDPRPVPRGVRRKNRKKKVPAAKDKVGPIDTDRQVAKPGDKTLYDAHGNVLLAYVKLNSGHTYKNKKWTFLVCGVVTLSCCVYFTFLFF